jgi:hypothetical protein
MTDPPSAPVNGPRYEGGRIPSAYEPLQGRRGRPAAPPILKPATFTSNERVYCHEVVDITVRHRLEYIEVYRGMVARRGLGGDSRLLGTWATTAHRNPELIQIWEHDSKQGLAEQMAGIWRFLFDDKSGFDATRWSKNPEVLETQGIDRLMSGTEYTPPLTELIRDGVDGEVYLHMHMSTPPGGVEDLLERLGSDWLPVTRRFGMKFVGAYRALLVNDDLALAIWAFPTWEDWARYEDARLTDREARTWFGDCAAAGVRMDGRLLIASSITPLRTGKAG